MTKSITTSIVRFVAPVKEMTKILQSQQQQQQQQQQERMERYCRKITITTATTIIVTWAAAAVAAVAILIIVVVAITTKLYYQRQGVLYRRVVIGFIHIVSFNGLNEVHHVQFVDNNFLSSKKNKKEVNNNEKEQSKVSLETSVDDSQFINNDIIKW